MFPAIRLMSLAALLALPAAVCSKSPAVAPAGATVMDRASVAGQTLALVHQGRGCALSANGVVHALGIDAPCRFLRRGAASAPAVQKYGTRSVILVGGPPAPASAYPTGSGEGPADRCSDVSRAVFVTAGKIALGEVVRELAGFCPDIAPDEKYYRMLIPRH